MTGEQEPLVSIVMPTHKRLGFLQQAVTAVLECADVPFEFIIWSNAAGDETTDWLNSLDDPRIRVVHSETNVGCNAYELGFRQARGQWLMEMDDDVLELPEKFLSRMIAAFAACPELGFLSLDTVRDDKTNGGKPPEYCYSEQSYGDICLQFGPAGGWCAMTPRWLYEGVHFPLFPDRAYFHEDGIYTYDLERIGYRCAILKGVCCYHAMGVWWNAQYQEYWEERCKERPEELRRMKLFVEKGILVKDTQRPWSVRKCLGDLKRWLLRHLGRSTRHAE